MLYIVSTPIGNLQDITFRAVDVLKKCDLILAEDTRVSRTLLTHYGIQTKCVPFHEFNEAAQEPHIIEQLRAGKEIALISDAGTPLISDPGERLVNKCLTMGLAMTSVPGPCAVITALTLSGFAAIPFQFVGFLPRKEQALHAALEQYLQYLGTTICYESGQRLHKTIAKIAAIQPSRQLVIARELTKKFETIYRDTAIELEKQCGSTKMKGELVLLIGKEEQTACLTEEEIRHEVAQYRQAHQCSMKEACRAVSKKLKLSARQVYQMMVTIHHPHEGDGE